MSVKRLKTDPKCGWCCYNESDGHCSCTKQCNDCGKIFIGSDHNQDECIKILKSKLTKTNEKEQ